MHQATQALPNRGGGGGHVAQINGLVEGVLLHNLDPEVTVEDLTVSVLFSRTGCNDNHVSP